MPPSYNLPQSNIVSVASNVCKNTDGDHITFIFSIDNTCMAKSDEIFARFANNRLETN